MSTSRLPDQHARDQIRTALDTTMLVEAAAGTGKTTCLVGRMVALVRTGTCPVSKLAAITFTKKAAAELRARFQVALERAFRDAEQDGERARLREALDHVEQCLIGTIHSFCARLLRERPVEAGVDVAFRELGEEEERLLREEAWNDWSAGLLAGDGEGILRRLDDLGLRMEDLADAFHAYTAYPDVDAWPTPAVDLPDWNALQNAARQYYEHIAGVAPDCPADEGRDRLTTVYRHLATVGRHVDFAVPAELMRFLERFDKRPPSMSRAVRSDHAALAKEEQTRWKTFRKEWVQPTLEAWYAQRYALVLEILACAADRYETMRASRGALTFAELLVRAAQLLREHPHIRRHFQARFQCLLVDEFQDTDPIQAEVMLLLTATDAEETDWRRCTPRPGSLFVVGDPKQSIYRFRRADIVTYNEVKASIDRAGGRVLSLQANFRTTGPLIDWNNEVFGARFPADATAESPAFVPLAPGRVDGPAATLHGVYRLPVPAERSDKDAIRAYDTESVARVIRHAKASGMTVTRSEEELAAGVPARADYDDFLIVTRNKQALSKYARALQRYGIPFEVSGGALLQEMGEIRLLHACLQTVLHPDNPVLLVGALRSALFGVSDASLYAFRRAGGVFRTRAQVPDGLDAAHAAPLRDAFERLARYGDWLMTQPPVAAIERIVADLGLGVRACASAGGSVQAGALCKAVELLRLAQAECWSAAQLADRLGQMVHESLDHDAPPLRPTGAPAVRLMNLHKVKGLEAPVVFLADPAGAYDPPPGLHVDRAANEARGYLAAQVRWGDHGVRTLARPAGWEDLAKKEKAFQDQERIRLLYVAATRAGSALIVSERHKHPHFSPWAALQKALAGAPALPVPADPPPPEATETMDLSVEDVERATAAAAARVRTCIAPTYDAQAAKDYALSSAGQPQPGAFVQAPGPTDPAAPALLGESAWGEHGTERGEVIHALIETATRAPDANLLPRARELLADRGLDASLAETAVRTVASVLASPLMQRARAAEACLVEVPFTFVDTSTDARMPVLVRGVVDLAFREPAGWVIVDHKTDAPPGGDVLPLAERYAGQLALYATAWTALTREPVAETGLYFVQTGQYMRSTDAPRQPAG